MRGRLARWAAIALPIVLVLRVLLMIAQMPDKRSAPAAVPDAPPPPVLESGQVIRFPAAGPSSAGDGKSWRSLMVVLLQQDGQPVDTDSGCSLDPSAMAGGTLTLRDRSLAGNWIVDWNGERTTPQRQPVSDPDPDPAMRAIQASLLYGADCGASARLEATNAELAILLDVASGKPAPLDAAPPRLGLHLKLAR